MDWIAAQSYIVGYTTIIRSESLVFMHNYLFTWSIAIFFSLIPTILFICAPSSLRTTRTSHFLLICLVCLSNMCSLYIHPYMISTHGELTLSYHSCRFIVFISTLAKPMELYVTLLFSIERLFTKILSNFLLQFTNRRQLFQRLYSLCIFLGTILIFSTRLYSVLLLIKRNQSTSDQSNTDDVDTTDKIATINNSSSNRNVTFKYCFSSMDIDEYATFLSFYTIQYWFEFLAFSITILILLIIIIHQFCLPRIQRPNALHYLSVNTKLYLSLSSCTIASESILLFFHYIVDDADNDGTTLQIVSLKCMLFVYSFRCIVLPLVICLATCDPLKQLLMEIFIARSYLDYIDESDTTTTIDNQAESFSPTKRKNLDIYQRIRRKFIKNKTSNDKEYLAGEET
ncbi:unnamed protein product [Rotaria magnacalcarata]|uniref:Uncharacterized protein n=2 Tax=Rotaria magnacalcarata TaxID=392030 RepID=A0A816N0N3_9BILA|nr:unnamed protein product [Rotaria magnacalcarata]CAF2059673.1 unnamed protein product [Rotaria magnacalcarata]